MRSVDLEVTSHVARTFLKPKNGSGTRQLQAMLRKEGRSVSYKQEYAQITKTNNLGTDTSMEELRKLTAFLQNMQEKDPDGRYREWKVLRQI